MNIFTDYSPVTFNEKTIVGSNHIHFGMAKIDNIIPIDYIGWVGVTMSPCDSCNEEYLENPINAIEYYENRGFEKLIIETKHMGSRACIFFDKDMDTLKIYSRGLFEIKLKEDDLNQLKNELLKYCDIFHLSGIIFDTELEPWSFMAQNLITNDFYFAINSYKLDVGETDNLLKTKKVLDYFARETNVKFYIFDVVAIKLNNKWESCKVVSIPNFKHIIENFNLHNTFKMLNDVKDRFYIEITNYSKYEVLDFFDKITTFNDNNEICEGIVIKLIDRQLDSDFIYPPYIKCRGKDYLRIIYGIDYDDIYMEKLKKRNLKRKRIQSINEYIVNLQIHKTWLDYVNNKNIESYNKLRKLVAGFIGLREFGSSQIDATL